jgi:serine protease Do
MRQVQASAARRATCVALLWATLSIFSWDARAQAMRPDTQEVFDRFADRVVKIELIERESEAKSVIGSGFFVSADGNLITNYHVVSKLIHDPDDYAAQYVDARGEEHPLDVLAVDVVHDLAVARARESVEAFLDLGSSEMAQGIRLYSLGYPHDIGITIVEGTYNGLLKHSLYGKIHFTGSLNPGMSGGPTIGAGGKVVGINVSTAGNQVSFLVPVENASRLLESVKAANYETPKDFMLQLQQQLLNHQEVYFKEMLDREFETVRLGSYELPTQLAPFFKCWGDARRQEDDPYEVVIHQCSSEDHVYISRGHRSGIVQMRHRLLTTNELNTIRLFSLYTKFFQASYGHIAGEKEDVTRFRCNTDIVENNGVTSKAVLCVRRYRKLEGLYDVVLKAAVLGETDLGLETTLVLSGVSFVNAEKLSRRYLETIAWSE